MFYHLEYVLEYTIETAATWFILPGEEQYILWDSYIKYTTTSQCSKFKTLTCNLDSLKVSTKCVEPKSRITAL